MFSNKPQLGLPKHYSFDIYSIRIPPTEAYQGQTFDFSKGVPSKTHKKWRLMELIRLPSVRRIFFRASVYKASPGACFARATGRCTNVARFLIVKSDEKDRKVSNLSPIEQSIQAIAGLPKSIKRLKSGDLLLEVEKKSHITNLLKTKKLFDLQVKITLHGSLNTSKGVIRCQDLGPCTDDEILANLKSEGVMHVRNIQFRRNGVLRPTHTYVLTFNTSVLPKKVKAAYLSVNVEVYIPNPLRCYN